MGGRTPGAYHNGGPRTIGGYSGVTGVYRGPVGVCL